jgi:serine/threonine-protein kinase
MPPDTQTHSQTRTLNYPNTALGRIPLRLMQVAWVMLGGLFIAFYLSALPLIYDSFVIEASERFTVALSILGMQHGDYATMMTVFNLPLPITCVVLALLIFWKRRHDRMALIVSLGILFLPAQIGRSPIGFTISYPELWWIPSAMRMISGMLIILFLCLFPNGRLIPRWALVYMIIAVPFTLWVHDTRMYIDPTSRASITFISSSYGMIGLILQVWRYRYVSTRQERQQTKWIALGLGVSIVILAVLITLDVVLPPRLIDNPVASLTYRVIGTVSLSYLASLIIPIAFAIAILRSRLWDIDLIINRSLVVVLTTVIIGAGMGTLVLVGNALLGEAFAGVPLLLGALLAGATLDRIRRRVQHFIDRRFYRWRFDLIQLAEANRRHPSNTRFGALTHKTMAGYTIDDVAGKGGMGEVYRATAPDGRTVALKTLLDLHDDDERRRFEREAEVMRQLEHPNIARLFDAGTAQRPYLVLEWVEGASLGALLRQRGGFDIPDALLVLRGVANALDHAHARGVIHRDLKPDNILMRVTDDGARAEPILIDFGVAKFAGGSTLTGANAIGTITYMAPEQIQSSKHVTQRADLYALGVIAYEILTGKPPFDGHPGHILFAHLDEPPPDPRRKAPHLPAPYTFILQRALAKDPDQRWNSAGAFVYALEDAVGV